MRVSWLVVAGLLVSGCAWKNHTHSAGATPLGVQTLELDLASAPVDSMVLPVTPGNYGILVRNLAPQRSYAISIAIANETVSPLDLPQALVEEAEPPGTSQLLGGCEEVRARIEELQQTADEAEVPGAIERLQSARATCTREVARDSTLRPVYQTLEARAERAIAATKWASAPLTVGEGQTLTLRVVRRDPGGRRWTRNYRTGSRGQWRSTYGFNFINDIFAADRRFWLQELPPADTAGGARYAVRERRSQDAFNFVPSIFYTWMPSHRELSNWSGSWTVGLGFDFQAPVVSVGYGATYNQNATLSVGLSLHQVQRLTEQYTVGQRLNELVAESALRRRVYRPNPYIAVTIRSLSNPFDRPTGDDP